jgi:tetratricopeptide (TPR) repeat protein
MYRLLLSLLFCSHLLSAGQQASAEALGQQAVEAERRGDFASAVSAFRKLIRAGADSPELRANLGIAYFQMRDFNTALREFRVALSTTPDSAPANLFSGLSLLKLQRPKQALSYLEKAHRAQPGDPAVLLALGQAEIAANDILRARGYYEETTRLDPRNAEGWYGLGITDRVLAERQLKLSRQAAQADPARETDAKRSRALLDASGQAMAKAMQLDPSSIRTRMILGESFRIAERYDLAIQEYKAVVEQQPDLALAWQGLAATYSASGNDPSALNASARALALEPDDPDTDALAAGIYARLGDYPKAESFAIRALQLRPGFSSAQVVLAKMYLAQQEPQKALPELQSAVKDDTDGTTYYLLATTLRQLGKAADAAIAMKQYKQLHSSHVEALSGSR